MPAPQLVLASSSPYRRELLERLGIAFKCVSPHVNESRLPGETPWDLALRLSAEKAKAPAERFREALIIGSDQVIVTPGGRILGKPGDHETAIRQLVSVNGKSVELITGIALFNTRTGNLQVDGVCCEVGYRSVSRKAIEAYLEREKPYDCAGALKSEGPGIALLSRLSGDDPSAIVGLPLIRLVDMLESEGVRLF